MAGGLSTQNFMSGLAQGYSLADAAKTNKQSREMNDRRMQMAEDSHAKSMEATDMQLNENRNKQLLTDLTAQVRMSYETGEKLPDDFYEKGKPFGLNKLADQERRAGMKQAGLTMMEAIDNNDFTDPAILDAGNTLLQDQFAARTAKDGLGRRMSGIRQMKDGRMAIELTVTGKDGKEYKAPMTRGGTSDNSDSVILIDENKFKEMTTAALNQAEAAHLVDKAGDDPKALANSINYILTGQYLTAKPEYTYQKAFDEQGRETVFRVDQAGNKEQFGGSKAPTLSDAERKASIVNMSDYMTERAKIASSTDFTSKEDRAAAQARLDQAYTVQYGAPIEQILSAIDLKRQRADYSPLTVEELNAHMAGVQRRSRETNNSTTKTLADINNPATTTGVSAQSSAMSDEDQQLADLDAKSMDPSYPNNARDKFAKQAEAIRAAKVARNKPQAPPEPMSKSELFDRNMADLQSQLSNSTPEQAAAIVKKMADLATRNNNSSGASLADLASF